MRRPSDAIDNGWLDYQDVSHLSAPAALLVKNIRQALNRGDQDRAEENIQRLLDHRRTMKDRLEQGEATVMCALARYDLYDRMMAIDLLKEANNFYGSDQNKSTVVLWMLGACYVETTVDRDEGFRAWSRCLSSFKDLARRSQPDIARCYNERAEMIRRDLENLECEEEDPGDSYQPGSAASSGGRQGPKPEPGGSWLPQFPAEYSRRDPPSPPPVIPWQGEIPVGRRQMSHLSLFPVVEAIPAGGFGKGGYRPYQSGEAQADTILIDGLRYRMISLYNGLGKATSLTSGNYLIVKVTSDSMDRPDAIGQEGICKGDHVLIHLQQDGNDGDIVASEIEGIDKTAVLRRLCIRANGNERVLEPHSTNQIHRPITFNRYQQPGFRIHGVVVVVFKPTA